jgi:sugar-specific transcriptional regulator TrmB
MQTELIHLILSKIGLTTGEISVYLECLAHNGGLRIQEITDKTSIKRSTVNLIVDRLEAKGYLTHYIEGKRKTFTAQPPESLIFSLENTVHDFKNLIPLLSQGRKNGQKSKIRFFHGKDGIYQMYNESLLTLSLIKNSSQKELLAITPGSAVFSIMPHHQKAFIDKRVKNRIPVRWIAPNEDFSKRFLDNSAQELRKMKFFDKNRFPINMEIDIYADKLALYSLNKDNPEGFIIENLSLANSMRSIFNLIWTLLPYEK